MPSATIDSRVSLGRYIASSLWLRLRPTTLVSIATPLTTSPHARQTVTCETTDSGVSLSRYTASSLLVRLRPTSLEPENRTRIPSSRNEELISNECGQL